ncbi:MAG: hypothetical protein HC828_19375, partial [Blastochloris sp.]|nr:hypothetical protein [Blastochloris sp.]
MLRSQSLSRRFNGLLILGVCLLVLSIIPPRSVDAAIVARTIDNTTDEFSRGSFQRTSLGNAQVPVPGGKLADLPGVAQLGPIGQLREWFPAGPRLPKPLIRMGSAAIGNRIYIIGGQATTATPGQTVAEVWSIAMDPNTGALVSETSGEDDWRREADLIPVQGSIQPGFVTPVAPIEAPAVATVANSGGGGFIFVIGGNASINNRGLSSFAVRRAAVGGDGRISGWTELPNARIPGAAVVPGLNQLGLESASAIAHSIGGKTYVYLIGGLRRYVVGTGGAINVSEAGSKAIYFAEVTGDGRLVKSDGSEGWEPLDGIPISNADDKAGVWDAAAVIGKSLTTGQDALYIMGGQTRAPDSAVAASYSSEVYQAAIGGDGKLAFDFLGQLPEARNAHTAVQFKGNLYVTGGIPSTQTNAEPDNAVLSSYIQDNLSLPDVDGDGGGNANFLKNEVAPSILEPRAFHGSVVIPASSTARPIGLKQPNAYVYIMGGRGGAEPQGSDKVFYGVIGGSEDVTTTGFAPNGWYYSAPYTINILQGQVQEINWAAQVPRTAGAVTDIEVSYRVSSATACDNPGWTDADWQPLDGAGDGVHKSKDGQNSVTVPNLPARCFQYRAKLSSNSLTTTPSLLNFSLQILIPGAPDLTVPVVAGQINPLGKFTGLNVAIQNKNTVEQTISADAEDPTGSFLVDLFIFGPGEAPVDPKLPLTGADLARSKAYVNIPKSVMGVDATVSITAWCNSADVAKCTPMDMLALFPVAGDYIVIAAVDTGCPELPYACVNGKLDRGENNNYYALAPITVPKWIQTAPVLCAGDCTWGEFCLLSVGA